MGSHTILELSIKRQGQRRSSRLPLSAQRQRRSQNAIFSSGVQVHHVITIRSANETVTVMTTVGSRRATGGITIYQRRSSLQTRRVVVLMAGFVSIPVLSFFKSTLTQACLPSQALISFIMYNFILSSETAKVSRHSCDYLFYLFVRDTRGSRHFCNYTVSFCPSVFFCHLRVSVGLDFRLQLMFGYYSYRMSVCHGFLVSVCHGFVIPGKCW